MESSILRLQDYWHLRTRVVDAVSYRGAAVLPPFEIGRATVVALSLFAVCIVYQTVATGRIAAWTHPRPMAGAVESADSAASPPPDSPKVSTSLRPTTGRSVPPADMLAGAPGEQPVASSGEAPFGTTDPLERVPFAARRQPLADPVAVPLAGTSATGAAPVRSVSGSAIAAIAATYVGYPYVWGGTSPAGFDCSGLVWYVFQQAGIQLPRDLPGQLASGTRVAREDLQAGDVVFFVNTYQPGLSHSGIYLGGDRFVSAIDEATGVAVSNLANPYWVSRFYAATRPR